VTDYDDEYDDEPDGSGFEEAKADVERLSAEIAEVVERQQPGNALMPVGGSALDATSMKQSLAETRALVMRKREELESATKRMRAELDAQMSAARAMLAPVEKFVARLTEAIETVNLYLGRDEEIVTLRDGEPAPEGTPIVCRSMVLAMDEETAIDPEGGGIDASRIEEFDEWLMDSEANLNQVLPEQRGVVVIVPSTRARDYGDPWVTRRMNEANRHSYWLIRNGERVFRMDTNFNVGYRLVPARDEFTGLFYRDEYEFGTGKRKRVPVEPGSYDWQRAEEAQGARERHYMKVALILQGLIDRTTVFHPLPSPTVSLLKQESYEAGHVRLVDEEEFALTTGRQPFEEWLREHNAELRPGMRVMGAFNTDGFRQYRYERSNGHERITPSGAAYPKSRRIYTIEERASDGGLVFRYKREGDVVYSDWRSAGHEPKRRATCVVYATDDFILPLDLVTEDEMLDYLQARTERKHYVAMFPLLKAAIAVKREEAEAEAPFRQMLAGRLMSAYDLDEAEALEAVDDLVRWWKFTNKHHRPLVGDGEHEAKAVRMIEDEFGSRRKAAATDDPEIVARLKALPGVMLVGRQRDGSYIALAPEHRLLDESEFARNVYAQEWVTRPRGKTTERRWVLVSGTRAARWRILFSDERWKRWNRVATAAEHLSDPEAYEAAQQAIERVEANMPAIPADGPRRGRKAKHGVITRVTYKQRSKVITVHVWPNDRLRYRDGWGDRSEVPSLVSYEATLTWRRGPGGSVVVEGEPYLSEHTWSTPWRGTDTWTSRWDNERSAIIYRDDSAEDAIAKAQQEWRAAHDAAEVKRQRRGELAGSVIQAWNDAERAEAYRRFVEDYADPELWEGHLKTLRLGMAHNMQQAISKFVDVLLDDGQEIVGRTVGDLLPTYIEISTRGLDDDRRLAAVVERKREHLDDDRLAACVFRDDTDEDEAPDED
jgi:hypothetical protein